MKKYYIVHTPEMLRSQGFHDVVREGAFLALDGSFVSRREHAYAMTALREAVRKYIDLGHTLREPCGLHLVCVDGEHGLEIARRRLLPQPVGA